MILDALLQVCDAQQVTATAVSENTIDFGNTTPKRKIAVGEPMVYAVAITAKGTTTGSVKVEAVQSAAEALTSPQIIGELDLASGDVVAGKIYIIPLGQGTAALRYGGLNFTVTGTVDMTVDAFLMPASMASHLPTSYADGFTVS